MLKLRASKIGGCVRAYVLDLRRGEGEATPRMRLYWDVGKALEPVIMTNAGYDTSRLFGDRVQVEVPVNDKVAITGHPDGQDGAWVVECKTMRSFAYKKMVEKGLEVQFPQYLIQGSVYAKGLDQLNPGSIEGVKYLCLDKDTSVIQEILVPMGTLEPYWEKAKANALKIVKWLNLSRLPGRPSDLPYWYCLEAYCRHLDCRLHMVNRRKE